MTEEKNIAHKFLELLTERGIRVTKANQKKLGEIFLLNLKAENWSLAAKVCQELQYRLVAIWGEDLVDHLELNACLEFQGQYLSLRVSLSYDDPKIASFTPFYPGANRLERHTHDLLGIVFYDHPDQRRWIRHKAWSGKHFPLLKNFDKDFVFAELTPPDNDYPFIKANGSGIYEIPVGPVHAGIIEPGHFRFQVAGEDVINLEEHLGYVHKGIEKIAEGQNIDELIMLAGRVSGDNTVAYAWSAAQAFENAIKLEVPKRALYLRAIICERERIANHLGDIAAICNDVAFTFAYFQLMRLKELWLRINLKFFGHRLLMDKIIAGGVSIDLNEQAVKEMLAQISSLKKELDDLYPIIEANSGLHDRLKTTGVLVPEKAKALGALGYVGRASGLTFDLRRDAPYFPYDQYSIEVPIIIYGDVLARVRVRAQEILVSLGLLKKLLTEIPAGKTSATWPKINQECEGIGLIEGWRGEVFTFLRLDKNGKVLRFFPRDPSWFSWPALEQLIHGNIVPDFPVCNKSINGSYSGVDL
jgi:Ni,Fe-hydrogenase III large subunit/NADH:ubiquinone oxidoreductase subunit C